MTWGMFYWKGDGKTYGSDAKRRQDPRVPPLESHLWWTKRSLLSGESDSSEEVAGWMADRFAEIESQVGGGGFRTVGGVRAFALEELRAGNNVTFAIWLKDKATLVTFAAVRK